MLVHASFYKMVAIALKEIRTGSDRIAGIVTPAFLDDLLTTSLSDHLHRDNDIFKKLFKPDGPLGAFGAKIDMAFLVGIISDEAREDFHRIRKIRNEFAHKIELDTFDKSPVRAWATGLTIPDWFIWEGKMEPSDDDNQPKIFRVPSDKDIAKLSTPRGRFDVSCKCFLCLLSC